MVCVSFLFAKKNFVGAEFLFVYFAKNIGIRGLPSVFKLCLCSGNWISVTTAHHLRPAKCLPGKFVVLFFIFLTLRTASPVNSQHDRRLMNEQEVEPENEGKLIDFTKLIGKVWFNVCNTIAIRFDFCDFFKRKFIGIEANVASVDINLTLLLLSSVVLIDSCVYVSLCWLLKCSTDSKNALENGPPSTIQVHNENRLVLSDCLSWTAVA